ncbi:TPA: CRISPR-associated endonuclease Cas2 [Candidatus Poribacteria bacterium]|nr:CRISPR-associated endonuclease Cas2 [Candidatus Poribacteria bacterium]
MFYVVSYDISDDRLRNQVSKALAALGTRVQKSVFELDLPLDRISQVIATVATIIEETDSLRCYRICERCLADSRLFDQTPLSLDKDYYYA